ncbi:MAG: hypothetical protein JKY28_00655 [Sulfurimonas sp.]|nr:hypothetical protein [Sulfurimonas sp.]PHQ89313.1 MAG: hypothetical protein COB42_07200 [Sulfurimonas sp.]
MQFKKISYDELNLKAKEMYNFQKVSSVLADYGFTTMWLNNDWKGADFIGIHIDGTTTLKVQLKARLYFDEKYMNKNIYMCFIEDNEVYLYPHDELLNKIPIYKQAIENKGFRHLNKIPIKYKELLESYKL